MLCKVNYICQYSIQILFFYFITQKTMTGNIIANGTTAFEPIVTRLGEIATEFLPYMIYVAIGCLGVALAFRALKYILWYLQGKAKWAVRGR